MHNHVNQLCVANLYCHCMCERIHMHTFHRAWTGKPSSVYIGSYRTQCLHNHRLLQLLFKAACAIPVRSLSIFALSRWFTVFALPHSSDHNCSKDSELLSKGIEGEANDSKHSAQQVSLCIHDVCISTSVHWPVIACSIDAPAEYYNFSYNTHYSLHGCLREHYINIVKDVHSRFSL